MYRFPFEASMTREKTLVHYRPGQYLQSVRWKEKWHLTNPILIACNIDLWMNEVTNPFHDGCLSSWQRWPFLSSSNAKRYSGFQIRFYVKHDTVSQMIGSIFIQGLIFWGIKLNPCLLESGFKVSSFKVQLTHTSHFFMRLKATGLRMKRHKKGQSCNDPETFAAEFL